MKFSHVLIVILSVALISGCGKSVKTINSFRYDFEKRTYSSIFIYLFEPPAGWVIPEFNNVFKNNLASEFSKTSTKAEVIIVPYDAFDSEKKELQKKEFAFRGEAKLVVFPKNHSCCYNSKRSVLYQLKLLDYAKKQKIWEANVQYKTGSDIFSLPFRDLNKEANILSSEILNQLASENFVQVKLSSNKIEQ